MKTILILFMTLLCANSYFAQTSPSSHDWILCDGKGNPVKSSGQNFYIVFRSSKIEMYCGKDLNTAKSNGAQKTGTYGYDRYFIWWTWSNGEESGNWTIDNNLISSQDGKAMMRDVTLFK
jgi:hypothetical protein